MSNRFASLLALAAFCFSLPPLRAAAPSPLRPWTNYQTIMWIGDTAAKQSDKLPLFYQRLRDMGINTAMAYGDANPQPLLDQKFPYYVENVINKGLCLKWNSNVRDWDKFVTTWTKTGRSESAFVRDYCLDDPQWRSWARGEMQRVARKNAPHNPLAYDIRDELSTTISANPFDYDFSPITLAKFRDWLKDQYRPRGGASVPASRGDGEQFPGALAASSDQAALAALNAQWETKFATWDDVKPFTTDQIKNRMASGDAIPRGQPDWQAVARLKFDPIEARKNPTRWNFSPWCDFRTYMDISLASALDDIRQASHAADPRTPVGIEGTQMPSAWGGYDLWRLSQVLDWIEPYDIGNAREILGSFMPGKTFVTTVFEKDTDHARRRLWHLLLEGDRGCIIWWSEDCIDWKSPDYALTPKGKALSPVLKEMTSPLAQVFLRAEKEYDPIAIHYSQPSIQVDWLLESTVDGSTWHRRFSSFEASNNRMAKVRNAWVKAIQDCGYTPRFVSSQQMESGVLRNEKFKVLVLPDSSALSDAEATALKDSLQLIGGQRVLGRVFADESIGLFDAHGRLRKDNLLEDVVQAARGEHPEPSSFQWKPVLVQPSSANVNASKERLGPTLKDRLRNSIEENLKGPWFKIPTFNVAVASESHTRIHRYTLGSARLLAFERNIDYHMSEDLKQAGGNEALEKSINVQVKLAQPVHLYDLAAPEYLGFTNIIPLHVDPWRPSLFALLPEKVDEARVVDWLLARSAGK